MDLPRQIWRKRQNDYPSSEKKKRKRDASVGIIDVVAVGVLMVVIVVEFLGAGIIESMGSIDSYAVVAIGE